MEKNKKGFFEITVKAVVVKDDKVLILERSDSDQIAPSKFDLPGGRVEGGETFEEALHREIMEEVGIEVEIGPVVHHLDWIKKREGKIIFCKGLRFLAAYKNGEQRVSFEHEKLHWLNIDEAIEKLSDSGFEKDKRQAIINAKKYLELQNSLDSWKRCQADLENYRKDTEKRIGEMRKYAGLDLIFQLLPILDNFESSLAHVPDDKLDNGWVKGILYIKKQMEDVLRNNGVEEIETKIGDKFDPAIHEAIKQETSSKKQDTKNSIKQIVQKGYRIDGRVIRAAKVVVGYNFQAAE